ncbi:ADP-ribosylation factor 2 [Diplonema papillatum]|nr:ADP-ribosylation factor 2 [Diplonema papillatum]
MGCSDSKHDGRPFGRHEGSSDPSTANGSVPFPTEKPMPHYKNEDLLYDVSTTARHLSPFVCKKNCERVTTFKVLLTGLAGSGKTHLLYTLLNPVQAEEPADTDKVVEETLFITRGSPQLPRVSFVVADLGGQDSVREEYLDEALVGCAGIVFTVDSTTKDFTEANTWLQTVLQHRSAQRNGTPIPVLLLGTKNDLPDCANTLQLSEAFFGDNLENGPGDRMIHTSTCTIVSTNGHYQAAEGLVWLANAIRLSTIAAKPPTSPPQSTREA